MPNRGDDCELAAACWYSLPIPSLVPAPKFAGSAGYPLKVLHCKILRQYVWLPETPRHKPGPLQRNNEPASALSLTRQPTQKSRFEQIEPASSEFFILKPPSPDGIHAATAH